MKNIIRFPASMKGRSSNPPEAFRSMNKYSCMNTGPMAGISADVKNKIKKGYHDRSSDVGMIWCEK